MSYTAEIFQNEYLPESATQVDAVITVTATGDTSNDTNDGAPRNADATEVIIIDTSGSMQEERRMPAARKAARAAIACIRDGVHFAIIAGDNYANQVYPYRGLAVASDTTRAEAQAFVDQLEPGGGTAIGTWLTAAGQLFAQRPGSIAHAILLTDGHNQGETADELQRAIDDVTGLFQCDCRGVGVNWSVSELRKISTALLGTVDIVADPANLTADFEQMMTKAMGKVAANVELKVWTPVNTVVNFVKQVEPEVVDLTGKRTDDGPRAGRYPTGAWGNEARDFHINLTVPAGNVGDEMLAARISVVEGDTVHAQGLVRAVWTDDTALSTRINKQVAHYTGQAELAQAIQEGLEARKAGDIDTATMRLGRAAQLAAESGNKDTMALLEKVVDVEDAATGTVRVKRRVDTADEMALDTRSTKTVRVGRAAQ
jgi:hypothetical protein